MFYKSRIQAKIQLFFIAFCKVHLGRFWFQRRPESFVQYPLRIVTVKIHGGRIVFHFPLNENTEHLPVTLALKRMLTRYNFGASREMLHKVYTEEPVAPFIEIPRAFTLSNINFSETSRPIVIKFHLEHHWGGGLAAFGFGSYRIRTQGINEQTCTKA